MKLRRILPLLLVSAALVGSAEVRAQPKAAADVALARDLFKEGAAFANEQHWNEARDRYERSLALRRAPITLYSLGIAYQNLGRLVEALESYRAFLVEMPPDNPTAKPYEQPARDSVAALEKRVAKLDIRVSPLHLTKITLSVDGIIIPDAAIGFPRIVDPGQHTVVARADGYREATQVTRVAEAEERSVALQLVSLSASKPIVSAPIAPDKLHPPVVPTLLVASGSAAFAVGLTVGLVGVQRASDTLTFDGKDADASRRLALAGDVVAGVGIAAAGAGLTLLVIDKFRKRASLPGKPATTWVRPVLSFGEVGVVGSF